MRRAALVLLALAACDASYTDLRSGGSVSLPEPNDAGGTAGSETLIASGAFTGRAGHTGSGEAQLYRFDNGALELRFDASFVVSGAPGPVVVLSDREELGNLLDEAHDEVLARLASFNKEQAYAVPDSGEGLRVAWIWCQPFRVEIARAILTEVTE